MTKRVAHILAAAVLALAFAWSSVTGGARPQVVYGEEPTPTPTQATINSEPGGHGGGGGG